MSRRRLAPEEAALWRRATRDVAPLDRKKRGAVPDTDDPCADGAARGGAGLEARDERRAAAPAGAPARAAGTAPQGPASKRLSPFAAGDPALDRRARRGRIRPERALDLHGLTQAAARARLETFLERAAGEGLRCVLVITGKGWRGTGGDAGRDPFAPRAGRGVLRLRFFEWMEDPALARFVARAAPAAPRDGGDGAFYVFLKWTKKGS
ncbi:Smr/MutS family protein [Amphiplicatus metriothermophilus]|uniref:DNA-nicking endonuclease, Smr domain n=1 Tax=Amphiplicatus metriothermophilus TaxID=1519374 RepID=A0A239PLT2_9PROT|nr:Smr/MutS family protein [Amphiplicatus metriothermophilus]MBB5517612.1 DNA-nicking Smr family endonuclease [Amphiplicatus metriothermophilus]SNT68054.1 DNA-nicking endonuclease, Smr domain [Amphiplicatus metriothermophilus]